MPFICTPCGKTFRRKSDLERHSYSHSLITPYQCHYCHRYLSQAAALERHLRTHDPEEPWLCKRCEKQKFDSREQLEEHQKTCEGRQFRCQNCPTTFHSRSGLSAHRTARHPNSPKFQCLYCNRAPFLTLKTYEEHRGSRHGAKGNGGFKRVKWTRNGWKDVEELQPTHQPFTSSTVSSQQILTTSPLPLASHDTPEDNDNFDIDVDFSTEDPIQIPEDIDSFRQEDSILDHWEFSESPESPESAEENVEFSGENEDWFVPECGGSDEDLQGFMSPDRPLSSSSQFEFYEQEYQNHEEDLLELTWNLTDCVG